MDICPVTHIIQALISAIPIAAGVGFGILDWLQLNCARDVFGFALNGRSALPRAEGLCLHFNDSRARNQKRANQPESEYNQSCN